MSGVIHLTNKDWMIRMRDEWFFDDTEVNNLCFLSDDYADSIVALDPDNRVVYDMSDALRVYCKKHSVDFAKLSKSDIHRILFGKMQSMKIPPVFIEMDIDEETHRMGYTLDGHTFYDRNYIKHYYVIINHIKENAAFRKEFNNEILPDYLSFLGEPNPTPVDAWFYDVIENYF